MAEQAKTPSGKRISVNTGNPIGLLLGEALRDLSRNRMIRLATTWQGIVSAALSGAALAWYAPLTALGLILGAALGYLLALAAYLCWYARFVSANSSMSPLCPACTSRMWQFSCARCREPVPALAFFARGLLLAHCPHCGFRVSSRRGTLLAWCSTCSAAFENPHTVYGRPTYVTVWVSERLPKRPGGEWKPVSNCPSLKSLYYHDGDSHSAGFLHLVRNYRADESFVPEHLIDRTRLLLLGDDVCAEYAEKAKGSLDQRTIAERVEM